MQGLYLKSLRTTLENSIHELDSIHSLYVQNPDADFTRNRKITFSDTCWFLIGLQGKSMPNEVLDFFDHSVIVPTSSAFVQQRKKILTEAWDFLYHTFEQACSDFSNISRYGYHIYACDGSDVNICRNPDDEETFIHEGNKGYNAIHINALYDLLNHTYHDVVFQGKKNYMKDPHLIPWSTAIRVLLLSLSLTGAMRALTHSLTSYRKDRNS